MPWIIKKDRRCPVAKPFGVINKNDGTLEGCHVSEDKAKKQQAALYASDRTEPVTYETRHVWAMEDIEVREMSGGGMRFSGYAAVFNTDSEPLPFIERIMPGAFKRSLNLGREVRMFLNHNQDFVLATTRSNMALAEDEHGLRVEADLKPTSYALDLATNMREKIVTQMSFGFTVPGHDGHSIDADGRRLLNHVNLFDVSPVTGFPAYTQTSAIIRSLAERIGVEQADLALAIRALSESAGPLDDEQVSLLMSVIQSRRQKPKRDWAAELAALRG
jgi:HK97 family phage prohead protease